ncbi:hypothetical protein [Metabacillus sp. Hm71]
MWILTLYLKNGIKMFEFDTEEEAKEAFRKINGIKYLSHIIYI